MSPWIGALIVLGIGLSTAAIWWLVRPLTPRERLRDLSLIREDHTDDELEALYRLPAADRDDAQ
jgi:hypothetical protein